MNNALPVLYSFRRCPYAIRARLAIKASGAQVALREVVLKDKPAAMLAVSPKGTVPVLVLPDGQVVDESLVIMQWALAHKHPDGWLQLDGEPAAEAAALIDWNDGEFKQHLDHYKYADRFPQQPMEHYRQQGEVFLHELEQRLQASAFLLGDKCSLADAAVFPFIRQFAFVDKAWFDQAPYPAVQVWLANWLVSELFTQAMHKYPQWQEGDELRLF